VLEKQKRQRRKSVPSCEAGFFYGARSKTKFEKQSPGLLFFTKANFMEKIYAINHRIRKKASNLEKGYVASIAFFPFEKATSCCVASFLQRLGIRRNLENKVQGYCFFTKAHFVAKRF